MLTLQNTTYQSLTKCSVHQAAYKNVQKHTSINHILVPDVNIYGINTVKQLLVSTSLILLNTTLRIIIMDQGKIITFLVNFNIFMSK